MLESIGGFLGDVAIYITAFLGVVALYFMWVAFREWRTSAQAMFGVERDIATSEMMGAIYRAGGLIILGGFIFFLGVLGRQSGSNGEDVRPTPTLAQTTPAVGTPSPDTGQPAPPPLPTDTPQVTVTDVPLLPVESTETPPAEPTPQTATVSAVGGVWLRDAPNGGTIVIVPQFAVVEFLEGREQAGAYTWQRVRVVNAPPGDVQIGQEGWVAADFLEE